jgi:hypothetical protein
MRLANLVPPVASPHRDNGEFGQDDGTSDGSDYLLATLNTQTDMTIVVPNGYKCLKAGALASRSLLLHRHDLQDLILEGRPQEKVNNLRLLDGQGEKIDLLQRLDLHVLDQAAQLGDRDPLLIFSLASTSPVAPTTTATAAPEATAKASTEAAVASNAWAPGASRPSCCTGIIRHLVFFPEKEEVPQLLRWLFRATHPGNFTCKKSLTEKEKQTQRK